jgi:hypothetical protein
MDELIGDIIGAILWVLIKLPGERIARTLRPGVEPSGFRTGFYGILFWVVLIGAVVGLEHL